MRTIIAFFVLFALTLGLQQANAQSGKSYEEWMKEKREASKKPAAAKTPAKSNARTMGKAKAAEPEAVEAAPVLSPPAGTFMGTLACKDCKGIQTELILTPSAAGKNGSFVMKQVYEGKPADKSVVNSSGKWFIAKGNKQNPDAVVLQLIPTAGNIDPMYFLQVSDTEVKQLSKTQDEIPNSPNTTLRKL